MVRPTIHISDYTYILPEDRIARYPLAHRDESKLLIYRDGEIGHTVFSDIASNLPHPSTIVFNDTKVIPARMFFRKDSGAVIEIFCLEPHCPSDYALSFASTDATVWKTIVGNARKWKSGVLKLIVPENCQELVRLDLQAELIQKIDNCFLVRFSWKGGVPFSEVIEKCGRIPIPPYLNRETESVDIERYQTLYAKYRGSVAAPTAGLHFTQKELDELDEICIRREEVCLHVGAGTFLPVKSESIAEHIMHSEPFSVTREFVNLLAELPEGEKVVAVGTTSVRTLESLYFLGVHILEKISEDLEVLTFIKQWEPYQKDYRYSLKESMTAISSYMEVHSLDSIKARTQIIIVPGYTFRVVDVMVTNFHQPQSTLLLLIAAFIGDDWKRVYEYALGNGFRFLSYGDSSLLFRKDTTTQTIP